MKLTSERVMVGAEAMEELVRVLPVMVGWRIPHVAVMIVEILLASGLGYRL